MSRFSSMALQDDSLAPVLVEFGSWLPDMMDLTNPGAEEALNVIPHAGGYAPFKDLSVDAALALPTACRGAAMVKTLSGDIKLYAATTTKLFVRVGSAFTQLMTTVFDKSDYHYWQFVQFGSYVVALNIEVDPQVTDANTASDFTELEGDPPRAMCGAQVGDFFVLGNLDNEKNDVPRQPRRVRWNGFNRIDLPWITDTDVQSDFQDMPAEGGDVRGIIGREFGTIFQERMIRRMSYVGGETIFEFETVETGRGSITGPAGIIDAGDVVYFIDEDGFYAWNGVNSIPIGDNQVNKWFFSQLNYAQRARIVGALNTVDQTVTWAFPLTGSSVLTDEIIYCYKEKRWSRAQKTVEYLMSAYDLPTSLDDLTGNLDTDYSLSFDDPSYKGGRLRLAGFNSAHAYGTFTGSPLAAILDSSDSTSPDGSRVLVNSVRPIVDLSAAVATIQIGRRDQLIGGALTYGTAEPQENNGECSCIGEGRYVRFRMNIPAGTTWSHAAGVQVWRKALGRA